MYVKFCKGGFICLLLHIKTRFSLCARADSNFARQTTFGSAVIVRRSCGLCSWKHDISPRSESSRSLQLSARSKCYWRSFSPYKTNLKADSWYASIPHNNAPDDLRSRQGTTPWLRTLGAEQWRSPPRSPDQTPLDFLVLGHHQGTCLPQQSHWQNSDSASRMLESVTPEELKRAVDNLLVRAELVLQERGGIFSHLMWLFLKFCLFWMNLFIWMFSWKYTQFCFRWNCFALYLSQFDTSLS